MDRTFAPGHCLGGLPKRLRATDPAGPRAIRSPPPFKRASSSRRPATRCSWKSFFAPSPLAGGRSARRRLLAILHARLMRLQPEARRILRTASVFGETCWAGGMRCLRPASAPASSSIAGCRFWSRRKFRAAQESRFPGDRVGIPARPAAKPLTACSLDDERRLLATIWSAATWSGRRERSDDLGRALPAPAGIWERAIVLYTRAAERAYREQRP